MIRVLSLGAGVQSTTLALLAERGEAPRPDYAIFADTGWEPAAVYKHLDWIRKRLSFPVLRVSAGNIRDDIEAKCSHAHGRYPSLPWFMRGPDGRPAIGRRQCTTHYKVEPILRECRRLLGHGPRSRIPAGAVEMLIGISTDEAHRMRPARVQYVRNRWPLIEMGMSRQDCLRWLETHQFPRPPKSACIGCPFRSDASWREMRDNAPDEWKDAVAVDHMIRNAGAKRGIRSQQFMHRSLQPLDQVDLRTRDERGEPDLFGNECEGLCGT
jgi:hypothetical protein